MPRYFFDTDDGAFRNRDEEGVELADDEAARMAAQAALPNMANDVLPNGEHRTFTAQVRTEDGAPLYTVCLTLTGTWHNGNASAAM